MADSPYCVRFDQITKQYPGALALDAVSFGVRPGEVHALVGENGAGKSTLIKVLAGAIRPDDGRIFLDGAAVELTSARHAQALGISVVYQELSLAPDLSVAENVFLGRWPSGRLGLLRRRDLNARAASLLHALGTDVRRDASVASLTIAQQQMVEIARALSLDARVLLLDEPSAVLTPLELRSLFAAIRRLTASGTSVIYISHRLDEVFELAKTVTVLRDGRHVSTRAIGDTSRDQLIREMVGRSIEEEFPRRKSSPGEIVLRVEGLSAPPRFADVSFTVRAGEVFGLGGLVGAGRTSVGRAIFGAVPNVRGRVTVGDQRGPFRSPSEAMRAGVAFLPEDRKRQGLLLHRAVQENITLAHLADLSRFGMLRRVDEHAHARKAISDLSIKTAGPRAEARTLSGGNQQKVIVARWLQRHYPVIILDEPTRGVDLGAKTEMYALVQRMVAEGAAVVLISSELPELLGLCDRVGAMRGGRLVGVLDNQNRDVTQEDLLRLAVSEEPRKPLPAGCC